MKRRTLLGLFAGAVLGAACVLARRSSAQSASAQAADASTTPRVNEPPGEPAVGDRRLTVDVSDRMVRYSNQRYGLYFAITGVALGTLAASLRLRWSSRLRDAVEARIRNPVLRTAAFYGALLGGQSLLLLPIGLYSSFILPHQYGLATNTLGMWFGDRAKSLLISVAVGTPVILVVHMLMRRSPSRWWFLAGLGAIPLYVFGFLLTPILIDPLFNRFEPLRNQELAAKIRSLALQAGIADSRLFQVDASRRTRSLNAYVTGVGGTARIVMWDNLLNKLDEDEVLSVLAHEMGHYAERHVYFGLAAACVGTFFLLWGTDRVGRRLLTRSSERWEVRSLDDLAALPLLLLLMNIANFLSSPLTSAVSRTMERRADAWSLRLSPDRTAVASAFVKMSEQNLSNPRPPQWIVLWMYSHPPLQERIDRALREGRAPDAPAAETPPLSSP